MSREALEQALPGLWGRSGRCRPCTRRCRVNGQRLYQLARQGIEVERPARAGGRLPAGAGGSTTRRRGRGALRVECSKGTYIRTLIEDVAKAAGSCGDHDRPAAGAGLRLFGGGGAVPWTG